MYIRKGVYKIEDVLSRVLPLDTPKENKKIDFDGDMISMVSHRYHTFKEKGLVCVSCGVKGEFFAKEKDIKANGYHFNLYGIKDGQEVLMTKDHIVRKREGGRDTLDNYQTMCAICNFNKG
jgi:5-methylcytosine-specific restriction endonuclease McrA